MRGGLAVKATGIVRRIDDLGRVVIPKEIRRTMRIREGDPLEIFVNREGDIILKKYSPIGELHEFAQEYVEALTENTGHTSYVSDKEVVVAAAGEDSGDLLNHRISPAVEEAMENRESSLFSPSEDGEFCEETVVADLEPDITGMAVAPIVSGGDPLGAVIITSREQRLGRLELALARIAADFLARQMEE